LQPEELAFHVTELVPSYGTLKGFAERDGAVLTVTVVELYVVRVGL
jgi:hypothetical protein